MTKLLMCFPKHEGDGLYFDCYGHSEYRSSLGWNDCCVAVSTLCVMLINYVKDKYDIEPVILDEGHVRIEIEEPDDALQGCSGRQKDSLYGCRKNMTDT